MKHVLSILIVLQGASTLRLYDDFEFRSLINEAAETARIVLNSSKHPVYASNVPHSYSDKFALAESTTQAALAATLNAFKSIHVDGETLKKYGDIEAQMTAVVKQNRTVSIRFSAEERCELLSWGLREVEAGTKVVTESLFGSSTTKVINTVNESSWQLKVNYTLSIYFDRDVDDALIIGHNELKRVIVTPSGPSPLPSVLLTDNFDLDLTPLFLSLVKKPLNDDSVDIVQFSIDRNNKECHTPRRNPEVINMISFTTKMHVWSENVMSYFSKPLFRADRKNSDFEELLSSDVFIPVMPVFFNDVNCTDSAAAGLSCGIAMTPDDINALLGEQMRSLQRKFDRADKIFLTSGSNSLISAIEAHLIVMCRHLMHLHSHYTRSLDFIESMLRDQLVSALGKEIQSSDFNKYVTYHNDRLFLAPYAPVPFSHSVRRAEHSSPEGLIALESRDLSTGDLPAPVRTLSRRFKVLNESDYMQVPLSASASVAVGGSKTMHAWIHHTFGGGTILPSFGAPSESFFLSATARQFSSFILMIGRVSGPNKIDPTHAIVVKDADMLKIQLNMDVIPTAQEFRDATISLSPEQQRFARAFRSMQLSSTLFAIVVIPIKPQLERVLNLVEDTLTKEIQLSQDLLRLFIEYQIPSDLLSFDAANVKDSGASPLAEVKRNVEAIKVCSNYSSYDFSLD